MPGWERDRRLRLHQPSPDAEDLAGVMGVFELPDFPSSRTSLLERREAERFALEMRWLVLDRITRNAIRLGESNRRDDSPQVTEKAISERPFINEEPGSTLVTAVLPKPPITYWGFSLFRLRG